MNWRKVIKFKDRDGRVHKLLLSEAQLTTREVSQQLADHGYPLPPEVGRRKALVDRLVAEDPKRRILLVERPGWHHHQFLFGNTIVDRSGQDLVLGGQLGQHVARCVRAGSLAEWAKIAEHSSSSSYLVLALCLAFAAPLLRLAEIESGGVHLFGPSSVGKSTLQFAAGSVYGSGRRNGGYVRSWKGTEAAAEESAFGHCDLPLILDELKLLDSDARVAAQRATDFVYTAASGTGKARSSRYTGTISDDLREYRLLIISSGELSLTDQARAGGTRRMKGEEARLIDVPVLKHASGIFDRLPKGRLEVDSREIAEMIQHLADRNHGVAGHKFLKKLVREVTTDEVKLRQRLGLWIKRFHVVARVDTRDGYELRFAARFAIAYAAGLLAIDYGLVPWTRLRVMMCIRRCYRRALDHHRRGTRSHSDSVISRIRKMLTSGRDVVDCTSQIPKRSQILNAAAFRVRHSDGQNLIAIRPSLISEWIGLTVPAKEIGRLLAAHGLLLAGTNGKRTRQLQLPGTKGRRRYYCVQL